MREIIILRTVEKVNDGIVIGKVNKMTELPVYVKQGELLLQVGQGELLVHVEQSEFRKERVCGTDVCSETNCGEGSSEIQECVALMNLKEAYNES